MSVRHTLIRSRPLEAGFRTRDDSDEDVEKDEEERNVPDRPQQHAAPALACV